MMLRGHSPCGQRSQHEMSLEMCVFISSFLLLFFSSARSKAARCTWAASATLLRAALRNRDRLLFSEFVTGPAQSDEATEKNNEEQTRARERAEKKVNTIYIHYTTRRATSAARLAARSRAYRSAAPDCLVRFPIRNFYSTIKRRHVDRANPPNIARESLVDFRPWFTVPLEKLFLRSTRWIIHERKRTSALSRRMYYL